VSARAAILTIAVAAGCATTSGVRPDDQPDPRYAYLYGRFHINSPAKWGRGALIHPTLVLALTCENQQAYRIVFNKDRDIQVLRCSRRSAGSRTSRPGTRKASPAARSHWTGRR
jgi:hypothetical protein